MKRSIKTLQSFRNAIIFSFALLFSTLKVMAADATGLGGRLASSATAGNIPTPAEQLTGLAKGIAAIFVGDFGAFIMGVFGAITVIAIFLIVWQLFTFIFEKTVFSIGGESDSGKKYANWIGIGMGLLAVGVPHIYKFIYGFFGGFGMVVFVILVIAFALWKFVLSNRGDMAKENARFNQNETENLKAKQLRKKEESDLTLQKKDDRWVKKDIEKGQKMLKNDFNEYMSAKQIIDKMKMLFAQLASPNVNRPAQAQIQHQLMAKASAFAGIIKHSRKDFKKMDQLIVQTEKLEFKGMAVESNETKIAKHLIADFKKTHSTLATKEKALIQKFVSEALIVDKRRLEVTKHIEKIDVDALQTDDRLEKEIKNLQQALNNGQFAEANTYLVDIETAYRQVGLDEQKLDALYENLIKYDSEKKAIDKKLTALEKDFKKSLDP